MGESSRQANGTIFQRLSMVGTQGGLVKRLGGYDKSRHTPPKFASDRAQLFLGKICQSELEDWSETIFRDLRVEMGYKRKDIQLDYLAGASRIASKDFELERRYSLEAEVPDRYQCETELSSLSSADLAYLDGFNGALGPLFDRLRCVFRSELPVDDLIDAVEEAEGEGFSVDYPSDCEHCEVRIGDVDAVFRFDSVSLETRFGVFGTPQQLAGAFERAIDILMRDETLKQLVS